MPGRGRWLPRKPRSALLDRVYRSPGGCEAAGTGRDLCDSDHVLALFGTTDGKDLKPEATLFVSRKDSANAELMHPPMPNDPPQQLTVPPESARDGPSRYRRVQGRKSEGIRSSNQIARPAKPDGRATGKADGCSVTCDIQAVSTWVVLQQPTPISTTRCTKR